VQVVAIRATPLPLAAAAVLLRAHLRLRLAAQVLPRLTHRPARVVVDVPGLALVEVRAAIGHGLLQLAARRCCRSAHQVHHDHIVGGRRSAVVLPCSPSGVDAPNTRTIDEAAFLPACVQTRELGRERVERLRYVE